jgi:serine/threonine-protein kinase
MSSMLSSVSVSVERGPQPGDVIEGRYVLRDRIGEGGMGSVFLASQPALDRTVAIKVMHTELAVSPEHVVRFREEARIASRVRSASCVSVIDTGALADGTPYLVMEYIAGQSLGQLIADDDLPLPRALDLFAQVLGALGAIHALGIVHADIKSDNFLVENRGGRDHVRLIDFGLARLAGVPYEPDLENGEVMVSGTPEYMAPEIVAGQPPSAASDLYAAGTILYELLTGSTPFGGGSAIDIMLRQARDPVIPPSLRALERRISPALDRLVLRALHKRSDERFADAAAFARELEAAVAHPTDELRPLRQLRHPAAERRWARPGRPSLVFGRAITVRSGDGPRVPLRAAR